ncbi:MAG: hypothetical protein NWE89_14025 [Candidatus Bathyarchaeota archaeon]|nr:hypothetical protein [Candidatus Bathyarchaeota archaeon]
MDIIASLIELYFNLMDSINVRNISMAIIVVIIIIEFIEFFIKPEDIEQLTELKPIVKSEKKSFVLQIKNILGRINKYGTDKQTKQKEPKSSTKKPVNDIDVNSYSIKNNKIETKTKTDNKKEIIGSKTITIRTVIDGNYVYLERIEK